MTKNGTILRTFLFAVAALCVFSAATVFGISIFEEWLGIIVGIPLMIAAIPLHRFGKKQKLFYFLSYLLNSVACGFSASAYYICRLGYSSVIYARWVYGKYLCSHKFPFIKIYASDALSFSAVSAVISASIIPPMLPLRNASSEYRVRPMRWSVTRP